MPVNPVSICRTLVLVALLAFAACGDDGGRGSPASDVGTLAYVVTSCREVAGEATVQQELRIYRGDAGTVTAMSVGPLGPFTSYGLCAWFGRGRWGFAPQLGAFQRLGVTPDGTGVVFDLTDEFALVGRDLLPTAQRGRYYVRADGSGLRPLGPASRSPAFQVVRIGKPTTDTTLSFDPRGRQFTYVDRGPDEAGDDAPQVFVQQLTTGERRQLTRLPRVAEAEASNYPDIKAFHFIDARTILFARFTALPDQYGFLTVDAVDAQISDVPTVALGGTLIPIFQIIGAQWQVTSAAVPGEAVNPLPGASPQEVFATDGANVLQLTNFRRVDTDDAFGFFSPRDGRVYFPASADPLGTNPSHDCQMFSMEPLARDLRQVTVFHEGGDHRTACLGARRPNGCRIDFGGPGLPQNPVTGSIYFSSQCDPLGLNPNGIQLFAIQPDGTGLRQLTNLRGFVQSGDRNAEVETLGVPWVYAPHR